MFFLIAITELTVCDGGLCDFKREESTFGEGEGFVLVGVLQEIDDIRIVRKNHEH